MMIAEKFHRPNWKQMLRELPSSVLADWVAYYNVKEIRREQAEQMARVGNVR
jgi:hypothetical protein